MGKIRNNQSGFSTIESILVLVIVVLVAVVGFMVYKNHNKTTRSSSTTASTATKPSTTQTKTTDPYAGWNTYTATLQPVSFKYPKDWTVDNSTGNAPINQPDNQFIRINAPQRSISGTDYQFSFTFQVHTPSGFGSDTAFPVYSSTKLTNAGFPKQLYSLVLLGNAPAGSAGAGQAYSVEVSATNYQSGSSTDGNDTIPTPKSGQVIDMGGTFTRFSDNSLAYFTPSQFASLQEVQEANQIFSSLTQH